MRLGRLEISGSALAVGASLFYFDQDGVMGWLLLASALHELGHWCAIRALGGKVQRMRLSCVGAELRLSPRGLLSPGKLTLAALAGPATNLLLAAASNFLAAGGLGAKLYLFSGINLGLALFNLLPAERLDGGRALAGFLCWRGREDLAEKVVRGGSLAVTALLFLAGGLLIWQSRGRNFTVLLAGLWMLGTAFGEWQKEKI